MKPIPLASFTVLAILFALALPVPAEPIDVGNRNQLFIDTLFFEQAENVTLRLHPTVKTGEQTLLPDKPWENASLSWFSILEDRGTYRMWYECYDVPGWPTPDDSSFCYAESKDGIQWTKPDLGLFSYQDSTANNILFRQIGANNHKSRVHGTQVFLDPNAPPETRYKAVSQGQFADYTPPYRIAGMSSPDGLHWTRLPLPICDVFADSQYSCFWDADTRRYTLYGRVGGHGRSIGNATSAVFNHFAPLSLALENGDNNPPNTDLYNPAAMKYPHADRVYLMFPSLYNHTTDTLDIHLAVSRDGSHWTWPERGKPYIALSPSPAFDSGSLYMGQGMLFTNNEIWQYYSGSPLKHEEAELDALVKPENHRLYSRTTQRLDGFVSVEAGTSGGFFITPPLKFRGRKLLLNLNTTATGEVRVGLLDAAGNPIAGHSPEECASLTGDVQEGIVTWNNTPEISATQEAILRLEVKLREANLFSFKFAE